MEPVLWHAAIIYQPEIQNIVVGGLREETWSKGPFFGEAIIRMALKAVKDGTCVYSIKSGSGDMYNIIIAYDPIEQKIASVQVGEYFKSPVFVEQMLEWACRECEFVSMGTRAQIMQQRQMAAAQEMAVRQSLNGGKILH